MVGMGLACAALLVLPGQAGASSTFGSNLPSTGTLTSFCGGSACTLWQETIPNVVITSPIDGVVVAWRTRLSLGTLRLRVITPSGASAATGAGTSGPVTIPKPINNNVKLFPTRLPIKTGDFLGVDLAAGADPCNPNGTCMGEAITTGANTVGFGPPLGNGQTAIGADNPKRELMVQAVVEPDTDDDKYGDQTQDHCVGDPFPAGGACTAPVISGLKQSHRKWRIKFGAPSEPKASRAKRGTKFSFTLSESARVLFTVSRKSHGRYRKAGSFAKQGTRGANSEPFAGGIGHKVLKTGKYRITLVANDGRNASKPATLSFRIVRR